MTEEEKNKMNLMVWGVLLLILFATAFRLGVIDDSYWHVKVGEWILQHQKVPSSGIFSYSNADAHWTSHEWLSAVFLHLIFDFSGWAGLYTAMIFSLLATILLLLRFLLKRLSTVQSLIFVLFAFILMASHVLPRPHFFVLPIMVYWTIQLVETSESQGKPPFFMLPLMILWVNLHGSFPAGIAFSVFFAAEAIYNARIEIRKTLIRQWGIFIALCVASATITPHGINGLLLPFQLTEQSVALSRVTEWQSPNFHHVQPLEIWLMTFFGIVLLKGIRLPFFRLIFLLGLIHLSLKHIRYACDLLSVLSPLVLATPLAKQLGTQPDLNFRELGFSSYKPWFVLGACFVGIFLYLSEFRELESKQALQAQKVLAMLKVEQKELGNVLNDYNLGIYLIHQGYSTFIDSRAELYGDKFIKEYFDATSLSEDTTKLEAMIEQYEIKWTLLLTPSATNTYFALQPQWSRLYKDKYVTVYIHQSVELTPELVVAVKALEIEAIESQKSKGKKDV